MHTSFYASNPFAMLLDPEAVLAQVARSERLSRLQSRICRPLDKPLLPGTAVVAATADLAAYDGEIDEALEEATDDDTMPDVMAAMQAISSSATGVSNS